MYQKRICCPPLSEAVRYAAGYLKELGFDITASADMDAAHLLLPVPSFPAASSFLREALPTLSEEVLISGGFYEDLEEDDFHACSVYSMW